MKLQNLSIIFIIIMLPIILVVSYYLNLQKSTLSMQLSYDQKLLESTKEAIEAFEVNTTEWNEVYSNLSDSKRRDVMASINTFITSLSSNLGISGVAKENLLSYVPAIAFTLYDGYYVYAPAYTPAVETDADGIAQYDTDGNLLYKTASGTTTDVNSAQKEYKHTLTTYLPYSKQYGDIIVDYTLDNYIKVYGKDSSGNVIERSGNLVYFQTDATGFKIDSDFENIKYNGNEITPETLEEQIILDDGSKGTYEYIYDIQNEKYYYDDNYVEEGVTYSKFFRVVDGQKVYLSEDVSIGEFGAKFRKVVIRLSDTNIDVYQLLNGKTTDDKYNEWYVDKDNDGNLDERITENGEANINGVDEEDIWEIVKDISRIKDYSAMNYYIDANEFTEWAGSLGITSLEISADNNPENSDSPFAGERREVIKNAVQGTLDTSIMQYIKISGEDGLKIIHLSETDWDEVLRNASIIAFFEGVPIGLKYYNNYAIATSTTNNEFINKNEIYFNIERR